MNDKIKSLFKMSHERQNLLQALPFRVVIKGMLPVYLISLLQERSYHGTDIMNAISVMSNGMWKPSPGSIYPILKNLEEQGLINGEWKSGRAAATRIYHVTKKGRTMLPEIRKRLLAELREARCVIDQHIKAFEFLSKT